MAIPYRTAKFESANTFAMAIWDPTAKFNSRQYFRLYGMCMVTLHLFNVIMCKPYELKYVDYSSKRKKQSLRRQIEHRKNSVKILNRQLTQLDSAWAQKNQIDRRKATELTQMYQPMVDDAIRQVCNSKIVYA